jgi:hypothetical protein
MTQPTESSPPAPTTEPQGGSVQVYNRSGALVSIPVAQLPDAQAQGYSVAPVVPESGGAFETLKAGARGALRGATFGLQENIEQAGQNAIGSLFGHGDAGTQYHEESKRLEEVHPTATMVGEGVGMVGGTLAGEGLIAGAGGLAARGLGRGLASVSRTGELAGSLVGRAGAGLASTGALGRAVVSGAELGARGAVEMGLYSGAKELNEQMLGDPALNAEKIFAAAADGAEGGAIFGGALGSAGSLVKSGAKGLGGIAQDVLAKNADKLTGLADEQRWRALDPLKKFTEQANARVKGGTKAVGEVLGRYGIVGDTLENAIKSGDVESIGSKLDVAVEKVGQQLGDMTGASTATIPFNKINAALDDIVRDVGKYAGRENIVKSLEDYRISLANKLVPNAAEMGEAALTAPISIQDALFQRKGLDQLVYQESKSLDPQMRVQLLRDFRAKFENLIVDGFDEAATAAGNPGAKAELLGLKHDYQSLSLAQDAAEKATSRMQTNRNLSLTDYMAGGTGSHIGSAIGGAVLGPVGSGLGGLVGGAAGAALNKLGREKGNAIAAAVLEKLGKYGKKLGPVKGAELEEIAAQVTKAEELAHEGTRSPNLIAPEVETVLLPERGSPLQTPFGSAGELPEAASAGREAVAGSRMLPEFTERPEAGPPRLMAPRPEAPGLEPMPMAPEVPGPPERPRIGARPEMPDVGLEPVHPGVPEKPAPPPPEAVVKAAKKIKPEQLAAFEDRITDAIHHVDKQTKSGGMVHVSDLRAEFPEMSREQFDAAMWKAENDRHLKLATYNNTKVGDYGGGSGALTQEQLSGAIKEPQQKRLEYYGGEPRWTNVEGRTMGYSMAYNKPSGKPWARAGESQPSAEPTPKATGKSSKAAYAKKLAAWEDQVDAIDIAHIEALDAHAAKKASAESSYKQALADWEAGKSSAEGGFAKAHSDWEASKAAAESGHAGAVGSWEANRVAAEQAHADAVAKWSADIQRAAAEHAALLDKVAQFDRARAAIDKVDAAVEKAAKGIVLGPSEVKALPPASRADKLALRGESGSNEMTLRERYSEAMATVQKMQASQEAVIKRASVEARHMPETSKLLGTNALRAFMYMTSQTPPPVNQQPILGRALPARASDADMSAYLQKYDTARDPMRTLRKFARGRITTGEAQTLQVVSPEVFKELQQKSLALVIDRQAAGDPLPFAARQRMHVLLGVVTDPSQDPKLTKALQANLEQPDTQGGPNGPAQQRPKRPVQMPDITNKFDKLESM